LGRLCEFEEVEGDAVVEFDVEGLKEVAGAFDV